MSNGDVTAFSSSFKTGGIPYNGERLYVDRPNFTAGGVMTLALEDFVIF